MSKFNPPERARLVAAKDTNPETAHLVGSECTVIEDISDRYGIPGESWSVYIVDVDDFEYLLRVAEYSLEKLLPDSDSYQKSTWQDYHDAIGREVVV